MLIAASLVAVLPAVVVVGAHLQWLGQLEQGAERVFGTGPQTVDALALASVLRWLALSAAAIALLGLLPRWPHRGRVLIAAVIGLAALDLLTITAGYNPAITRAQASPPAPAGRHGHAPADLGGRARRRRPRAPAQHGVALGPGGRAWP